MTCRKFRRRKKIVNNKTILNYLKKEKNVLVSFYIYVSIFKAFQLNTMESWPLKIKNNVKKSVFVTIKNVNVAILHVHVLIEQIVYRG